MAASVDVVGLEHAYDAQPVVRGMSFSLAAGDIGCLLGPSVLFFAVRAIVG